MFNEYVQAMKDQTCGKYVLKDALNIIATECVELIKHSVYPKRMFDCVQDDTLDFCTTEWEGILKMARDKTLVCDGLSFV
jgi:hypothetical protein